MVIRAKHGSTKNFKGGVTAKISGKLSSKLYELCRLKKFNKCE